MKKVIVVGSGVSGLAAAACLAQAGMSVTVFEKNDSAGGRARKFERDGFVFDMGPSWYWMPDVFERFFQRFGKSVSDHYALSRLDPSYRVYFGSEDHVDVPAGLDPLCEFFEKLEPGSSRHLRRFLSEGEYKYALGMGKLVYKPGQSWREFIDGEVLGGVWKLHIFQSLSRYVRKFFKHPRLISLLEFPVLFLGAPPAETPALYSLMNYADMVLGTWYPMGGMYNIIDAMVKTGEDHGVAFRFGSAVSEIDVRDGSVRGVRSNGEYFPADYVVATSDYRHTETALLPGPYRQYSDRYWDTRVMAPSSLIFYLGFNKPIPGLQHHTLFFDQDMDTHLSEIYEDPQWPTAPQFYVCCPSKTDPSVAPPGHENLFILIPVAPGLKDDESIREKYFEMVMRRIEQATGSFVREHLVFKRSYAHADFISDYNAFKGNAYGLANTLMQTANLRPGIVSKKVENLYYAGQLTVPGPGLPPSIISGQVTADVLLKKSGTHYKQTAHASVR